MLRVMHLVASRPVPFAERDSLSDALSAAQVLRNSFVRETRDVWIENGLSATRPSSELSLRAEDLVTHSSRVLESGQIDSSDHRVRFFARSLSREQKCNLAHWLEGAARTARDLVNAEDLERQKWLDSERLRLDIQAVRKYPQEPTPRERRLATKAERTLDVDQLLGELWPQNQ